PSSDQGKNRKSLRRKSRETERCEIVNPLARKMGEFQFSDSATDQPRRMRKRSRVEVNHVRDEHEQERSGKEQSTNSECVEQTQRIFLAPQAAFVNSSRQKNKKSKHQSSFSNP
ncbi:unnamed protein product, partial [Sphacelaria rigidula]